MKRLLLIVCALALSVGILALVNCSSDDDDDDDNSGACEDIVKKVYDCGYTFGDDEDDAMEECEDADDEVIECGENCLDEYDDCDEYINCINGCLY